RARYSRPAVRVSFPLPLQTPLILPYTGQSVEPPGGSFRLARPHWFDRIRFPKQSIEALRAHPYRCMSSASWFRVFSGYFTISGAFIQNCFYFIAHFHRAILGKRTTIHLCDTESPFQQLFRVCQLQ